MKLKFLTKLISAIISLPVKACNKIRGVFTTTTTPYNAIESIYWLIKYLTGPSKKNAGIVKDIPSSFMLNDNIKPKYKLAFIGDIMPTHNNSVNIGLSLKEFLGDCDYLVGNFEGVITEQKKNASILVSDRRHSRNIIEILSNIFPSENTYLCVSNNHAADFGKKDFFDSVKMLESGGFNVFGSDERPFFDINENIRIISGTMWSNRKHDYICMLKDAGSQIKRRAFNFLYPHFGYEHELYPRPEIVKMGKELIGEFDAIIGHHSHCPQPICAESINGFNKLLAYSLGNFIGSFKAKKYQYGIILKTELGKDSEGRWFLGKVDRRFTKCSAISQENFVLSLNDENIV